MSSPHATGVAALALSAHPRMGPLQLTVFLQLTAVAQACPAGAVYNPVPLIPAGPNAYDAKCSGVKDYNGFYGAGMVNAYNVVK